MPTMLAPDTRAARLMLDLATIAWLAGCISGPPPGASRSRTPTQSAAYADPHDPQFGRYQIRLLNGGTEIEFVGVIGHASAAALEKALNETPQVKVVRLTSPGGETLPAMSLARTVRAKGVVTYVPTICASACTFVFLGGRERYVAPTGQLGFHRTFGVDDSETAELGDATRSWMLSHGVSDDFAARANSIPETTIWVPTSDELLRAHIITALTTRETYAEASAAERSTELLQSPALNTPVGQATKRLMLAIKKADPAAYRSMQEAFHEAIRSGSYESGRSDLGTGALNAAFKRAVATADDGAVMDFVSARMQQTTFVSAGNPRKCMAVASIQPDGQAVDAAWYLSTRKLAAMTAIFESSMSKPQPPPSAARVRPIFANVIRDVLRASPGDAQYLRDREINPARTCAVLEAIIRRAMSLDPDDRALLFRGILSGIV